MRIPVLVEPDYRNSLWARQTLEGIAREAARKKREAEARRIKRTLLAAQLFDLARMSTRPLEKDEITSFLSRSNKLLEMLCK